ncbi:hypothetical protein C8J55DRAFT_489731 [Lentinula edodes]|uniref:Uncharacterized protein n=1 Tax=Lentinula lateritia TaxID=40482 RepID=A0A9W9DN90_9AGAR|nr:hypothetical protein C8J55DRAFT_489731 [Lentinula edodes]
MEMVMEKVHYQCKVKKMRTSIEKLWKIRQLYVSEEVRTVNSEDARGDPRDGAGGDNEGGNVDNGADEQNSHGDDSLLCIHQDVTVMACSTFERMFDSRSQVQEFVRVAVWAIGFVADDSQDLQTSALPTHPHPSWQLLWDAVSQTTDSRQGSKT